MGNLTCREGEQGLGSRPLLNAGEEVVFVIRRWYGGLGATERFIAKLIASWLCWCGQHEIAPADHLTSVERTGTLGRRTNEQERR